MYTILDAINDELNKGFGKSKVITLATRKNNQGIIVDGPKFRIEFVEDIYGNIDIMEMTDNGKLGESPRYSNERPCDFDGSAEKLKTRDGMIWWMPPADAKHDPAIREQIKKYLQSYFLEQWSFIGIKVTLYTPPCPHCHQVTEQDDSLWGIESNSGTAYFVEIVENLLHEMGVKI